MKYCHSIAVVINFSLWDAQGYWIMHRNTLLNYPEVYRALTRLVWIVYDQRHKGTDPSMFMIYEHKK